MFFVILYFLEICLYILLVDIIIDKENSCIYICILFWGEGGKL